MIQFLNETEKKRDRRERDGGRREQDGEKSTARMESICRRKKNALFP